MLCDPVSGLPIVTVSTLSSSVDPYLLPLQATANNRLGGGGSGGMIGTEGSGYVESNNNNNPSASLASPRGGGGVPTMTAQTVSSPTTVGSPATVGRKRGVSFAPTGGLGPHSPPTATTMTSHQQPSGDDGSPVTGGRKRRMSIMTTDTRNSSVGGLSSPRGGAGGGEAMDGGAGSSSDPSSQLRPQSVYDWLGRCMPAVRVPGAPTKMVSTDSSVTAPRHPILLHCTPALKLPQHDVGKIGYKRRLVVCTRDELLCFREDGLMKVRIGWDDILTAQHIPVSVRLPADGRITSTSTTSSYDTIIDTTSVVHVILFVTNSTSRDVGLVFRSGQDAQALINIAVIRKRQMINSNISGSSSGYHDEDGSDGGGELTVYRRDLAASPISSSQLQSYLSSGGVVALKRPPNQAPLPSTVPTIELLSSTGGSDLGGAAGSGGLGGGVLYQAISELQREADRCKHETATAATTTHWTLLSQYRDAINYASEKKIELDASRAGYLRRHSANESTLDKVKQNLADARAELRSVSSSLLSTRDGHDKRISKLREECHNSEERSKSIVINTNQDDMNLSSKRQKALLERNRLTNEVSELKELLGELRRQCPSSSDEKEVEIQCLRKELRKLEQRTDDMREESRAIRHRIQQGGALTKLTSVGGGGGGDRGTPSRSESIRPNSSSISNKNMSGANTSDVVLSCAGDGVEVSAVFQLNDDEDNPTTSPNDDNNITNVESLQLEENVDNADYEVDFVVALKSLERHIEESEVEKSTLEAAVYRTELALRNTKVLVHKQQQSAEQLADAIHNQNLRNMEVANQRRALETEVENLERRVSLFSMETMIVDDARRETHLHASIADTASRSYDFTPADQSTNFASPLSRNSRLTFSSGSPASHHNNNTSSRDAIAGLAALNKEAAEGGDSNEQRVASQLEHLRRIKERLQRTVDGTY